jgi:hypothetical protein
VTNPNGGRPARRSARWAAVGVPVALAALIAVAVAAYLVVDDGGSADTLPSTARSTGSSVPLSALAGAWSGEGSLTDCAGFADENCPATRSITLTIDCVEQPCVVTPFDRSYGRPPLKREDGGFRAAGPLPPEVAPTCGGTPTSSGQWRLDLTALNGRLEGSYAESTVQGFDCGATHLRWEFTLDRV